MKTIIILVLAFIIGASLSYTQKEKMIKYVSDFFIENPEAEKDN